jgi:hypothetical protein
MRNSSARCRHQPEQTATCQSQSSQKKTRRVSSLPRLYRLPDDAAGALRYSRACPSCGQGNFPGIGRPERVLNELFPNGRLLRIFRLRVAEEQHVAQVHLLPGTLLPQRKLWNSSGSPAARNTNPTVDCFRSKRLRRFCFRVARTSSAPRNSVAGQSLAFEFAFRVSHLPLHAQ